MKDFPIKVSIFPLTVDLHVQYHHLYTHSPTAICFNSYNIIVLLYAD